MWHTQAEASLLSQRRTHNKPSAPHEELRHLLRPSKQQLGLPLLHGLILRNRLKELSLLGVQAIALQSQVTTAMTGVPSIYRAGSPPPSLDHSVYKTTLSSASSDGFQRLHNLGPCLSFAHTQESAMLRISHQSLFSHLHWTSLTSHIDSLAAMRTQ